LSDIEKGKTAPDFALPALDGVRISLAERLARGPVVAAFFKISCPVCQFTFPYLQRLYERYGAANVSFLGVSQDNAKNTAKFCRDYGVTFPVLVDDEAYTASNAYGLTNVPTFFLIAPDATVEVAEMGFGKAALEEIAERLAEYRQMARQALFAPSEVVPAHKPG